MAWRSVGTLSPSREWQLLDIPVVGGEVFRVSQTWTGYSPGSAHLLISAFYSDGGRYGSVRVYPDKEPKIFLLPVPNALANIGLTVRYLSCKLNSWARVFHDANWQIVVEEWSD